MSEEMKCPVCGSLMQLAGLQFMVRCSGDTCWFRCNTEDLPRIATAMELARVTAWDCTDAARKKAKDEYVKAWREE